MAPHAAGRNAAGEIIKNRLDMQLFSNRIKNCDAYDMRTFGDYSRPE